MSETRGDDLDLRGVAIGAAAILAMIIAACVAAWFAWSGWKPAATGDGPDTSGKVDVDGPRLEAAPRTSRDAYFDEKNRQLHGWQWVDRKAGIARIPIEDAMDLLVRQGKAPPSAQEGKR